MIESMTSFNEIKENLEKLALQIRNERNPEFIHAVYDGEIEHTSVTRATLNGRTIAEVRGNLEKHYWTPDQKFDVQEAAALAHFLIKTLWISGYLDHALTCDIVKMIDDLQTVGEGREI